MNEQPQVNPQRNLIPYRVVLLAHPDDELITPFLCTAVNDQDALDQAKKAYPGCEIQSWLPYVEDTMYVIYSPSEADFREGEGFWGGEHGWVDPEYAVKYTAYERINLDFMPMCPGMDAIWTTVPCATLSVEISAEYILNGQSAESMRQHVERELQSLVKDGLLSGSTPVEVNSYSITVRIEDEEEPEIGEDDIAEFIRMRIEDGNLSLEDIPRLMARYGLQDPKQFIAEMTERMELSEQDDD